MTDETLPKGGEPDLTNLSAADVRFCHRLMRGETEREAYIAEFGACETDPATLMAASGLVANHYIQEFLEELRIHAVSEAKVTVDALAHWSRCVMNADIRHLMDANGNWLEPKDWPEDIVVTIEAVEFEGYTAKCKKKLRPKRSSFRPRIQLSHD